MPDIKPPIKIMALEKGPGPGIYILPPTVGYEDHDVTKSRYPAYSLGCRRASISKFSSPGPIHWIESGTTRCGSKKRAIGMKIGEKLPGLRQFVVPGPGAYSPENCRYGKGPTAPAYSMTKRINELQKDIIPGPNCYNLPSTIGTRVPNKETAAAFSMTRRRPELIKFQSPGPAAYGSPNLYVYKERPPMHSMSYRRKPLRQNFPKPGPAEYYPMYNTGWRSPEYSFGTKHSEYTAPLIVEMSH